MEEEPLFAKYASILGSFSIPLWQNNVTQFLSSHRKYRILWWEFGPTMLEHLCKKEGLNAKELKQKNENHENLEEETLRLLQAFGEVKAYWWWAWSKKIKEVKMSEKQERRAIEYARYSFLWRLILALFTDAVVHQFRIVQYGYTYNYEQLKGGGMIGEGIHIASSVKDRLVNGASYITSTIASTASTAYTRIYGSTETKQALQKGRESLIKELYKVDDNGGMRLDEALKTLKLEWLLTYLDCSLIRVEKGKKPKDRHEQYFKEQVNQAFRRLSVIHHPDKSGSNGDAQKMINDVWHTMRKIHRYAMQERRANEKYGHIYRLFGEIPISVINGDQDISEVVNIAACSKLYDLAYWEEGELMQVRNNYLDEIKTFTIKSLQTDLKSIRSMFNGDSMRPDNIQNVQTMINKSKKEFNKYCDEYKKKYKEYWLENLKLLSEECGKSQEFKIIKPEVDKLLKEGKEQYKILNGYKSDKVKPDEVFVQPALEYTNLVEMYYKFIIKLCEDIKSCFPMYYFGFNEEAYNKQKFIVGEGKTEFIEKSEDYIRSKLSHGELSEFLNYMISYYYGQNKKELRDEINKYYPDEVQREEIGNVLIFALDHLEKLYQEEFQQKENWFEKEKRRMEEARKEATEIDRLIAEARADRLEIKDRVRRAFTRQVCKLDSELQDIVLDGQDQIVDAVVDCIEKHGGFPEQIVSIVMEEIKLNREQVIRENTVNAGLINAGIEKFVKSENNTVSDSQNLNQNTVCTESDGRQQPQSDQVATNLDEVEFGSEVLHHSSI